MGEYVATETVKLMLKKGIQVVNELPKQKFDAVIAAVAHKKFEGLDIPAMLNPKHVVFDVKCTLDRKIVDGRL